MIKIIAFLPIVIPLIYILYYVYIISKRDNIKFEIVRGIRCYNCKSIIKDESEYFNILLDKKSDICLCVTCNRDIKINSTFNRFTDIFYKFKKHIIKNNISIFYILPFALIFLTIDLVFKIKIFSYLYNITLYTYWILTIYQTRLVSIKKTKIIS